VAFIPDPFGAVTQANPWRLQEMADDLAKRYNAGDRVPLEELPEKLQETKPEFHHIERLPFGLLLVERPEVISYQAFLIRFSDAQVPDDWPGDFRLRKVRQNDVVWSIFTAGDVMNVN